MKTNLPLINLYCLEFLLRNCSGMWRDRLFPLIMSSPQILSSIQGSDFVPWCWWRANLKRLFQMWWNHPKSLLLAKMTMMILKTKTSWFDATSPPQSESNSNLPGDDSEKWSPTSEKQVSIQKPFARHDPQITNWLYKKFSPRVFVNSIFEIEKNHSLPETKTELLE